MKELKRQYWNPGKTAKGMTLCSGCPLQSGAYCSLGYEIRNARVAGKWVAASKACELVNVTWTVLRKARPDVEQETG